MQDGFIKSRIADAVFLGRELVAFGATDLHVVPASDATKPLAGVADSLPVAPGQTVDVQMTQIADVVAGGAVAAGQRLMTDANGHVVPAAKQAGVTVYTVGIAQQSAVLGDIFPALVILGAIDG